MSVALSAVIGCLTDGLEHSSANIRVVRDTEDARVALFEGLIDHAPLFPPASLPLEEALAEDGRARSSSASFMLGRLVWPASRLGQLEAPGRGLSVVLDVPFEPDEGASLTEPYRRGLDGAGREAQAPASTAREREKRGDAGIVSAGAGKLVEAVEVPPGRPLELVVGLAPEVYVEVAPEGALEDRLDGLTALGLRAKVRCGGATTPTPVELARFLRACRERELPFKATAGLHHAVRRDGGHGFLNVLAAVVFGDEEEALRETDAVCFRVDGSGFRWRDRSAAAARVAEARRTRLCSIGSCSFFEPVAELEALGMLP
jgi:hypothetical protein